MRNLPTPARASSPACAEPVAPQPTIATRPLAKQRCPSTPMPWNKVWREYRSSIRPCRIWASCLKEVTSARPQNLYYKCAPAGAAGSCATTRHPTHRTLRTGAIQTTPSSEVSSKAAGVPAQGHFFLRRQAWFTSLMIVLLHPAVGAGCIMPSSSLQPQAGSAPTSQSNQVQPSQPAGTRSAEPTREPAQAEGEQGTPASIEGLSQYLGRPVEAIEIPGVPDHERNHLLELLPLKVPQPLDRDRLRESIRALYATGRFAEIQAEASPSGRGVLLTFATVLNYFVGSLEVEGAPDRPNANQIANATKFNLGELYSLDKLDRGLQNIRQLIEEN